MDSPITFNIGKDFDTPFSIDDEHTSVSRNHASITIDNGQWILTDNDSTNGTFVEENNEFRRCKRVRINPDTWIRLGEEGHRGFYFKARRIIRPNDFREDFEELNEILQEFEQTGKKLDSNKRTIRFLTPFLLCIGFAFSFLPGIKDNGMALRAAFMLPGFISPFIQDALLNKLDKKYKALNKKMICPKCRRAIGKDDILNRTHYYCKAR